MHTKMKYIMLFAVAQENKIFGVIITKHVHDLNVEK